MRHIIIVISMRELKKSASFSASVFSFFFFVLFQLFLFPLLFIQFLYGLQFLPIFSSQLFLFVFFVLVSLISSSALRQCAYVILRCFDSMSLLPKKEVLKTRKNNAWGAWRCAISRSRRQI